LDTRRVPVLRKGNVLRPAEAVTFRLRLEILPARHPAAGLQALLLKKRSFSGPSGFRALRGLCTKPVKQGLCSRASADAAWNLHMLR
jgi:hypothetical protein